MKNSSSSSIRWLALLWFAASAVYFQSFIRPSGAEGPSSSLAREQFGAISGLTGDATTGDPIQGLTVQIWDSAGILAGMADSNVAGAYTVAGLQPGTYFASSADLTAYIDELYDDLPCPGGGNVGCDPTSGTPIEVIGAATTTGIDFALLKLGALSGTVTEAATGAPISNIRVEIWDAAGAFAGSDDTGLFGSYTVTGLNSGTFFATTANMLAFIDELYDDLPCPGGAYVGCTPNNGTPIAVSLGATTTGIDFALDDGLIFADGFESGDVAAWSSIVGS